MLLFKSFLAYCVSQVLKLFSANPSMKVDSYSWLGDAECSSLIWLLIPMHQSLRPDSYEYLIGFDLLATPLGSGIRKKTLGTNATVAERVLWIGNNP